MESGVNRAARAVAYPARCQCMGRFNAVIVNERSSPSPLGSNQHQGQEGGRRGREPGIGQDSRLLSFRRPKVSARCHCLASLGNSW